MTHNYFVYITTNATKKVLYTGVTNDLYTRLQEHYQNRGKPDSFAGKYYCYYLIYFERHTFIQDAIDREKEIKKWRREKNELMINEFNPTWKFLNGEI